MSVEDLLRHPLLWRGQDGGTAGNATLATGFADLDRYLPGGGWPLDGISEIFIGHYGLGELRILMPALAALSRHAVTARQWIVWVAPPFVPYAPALADHGVDLSRILLVHPGPAKTVPAKRVSDTNAKRVSDTNLAKKVSDTNSVDTDSVSDTRALDSFVPETREALWAVEQVIRSRSSVAVLAWVKDADMPALRRLQLGAEACRCWTVLFRPLAAIAQSSPAALRFSLTAARPDMATTDAATTDTSIAGRAGIHIEIQKCRGRRPRSFLL